MVGHEELAEKFDLKMLRALGMYVHLSFPFFFSFIWIITLLVALFWVELFYRYCNVLEDLWFGVIKPKCKGF